MNYSHFKTLQKAARGVLLAVVTLVVPSQVSADEVIIPMGYDQSWTARTLFNPDGTYTYHTNVGWLTHDLPELHVGKANEQFEFTIPVATQGYSNGIVELRSTIPVAFASGTRCTVSFTCKTDKEETLDMNVSLYDIYDKSRIIASTNSKVSSNRVVNLNWTPTNVRTSVNNLVVRFSFATQIKPTKVTITDFKVECKSGFSQAVNLWEGATYYTFSAIKDPAVGRYIPEIRSFGSEPTMEWTMPDFDDSLWDASPMPLGNEGYYPAPKTIWPEGDPNADFSSYWIRRTFNLDKVDRNKAYHLLVCHDDYYRIFVNGHLIEQSNTWTDNDNPITLDIPSYYLIEGKNVIATEIQQTSGGRFYDCSLTASTNNNPAYDPNASAADLIISEVTVANIDRTLDYSNNYGGWVEFYNPTNRGISLDNVYVSNDPSNLRKHRLTGQGAVPPHDYKCIFFDNTPADGEFGPDAYKQVSFKLTTDGGTLYISNDGVNVSQSVTYPAAVTRCSWARKSLNSDEWGYNALPTPGDENSNMFASSRLAAPVIDIDSRLFSAAFNITITKPEGAKIYYTRDGSAPSVDHGEELTANTLRINDTSTLRFVAVADGYLPSTVVTRTYIKRNRDYTFPIVAVSTDPVNLYDDYIGVYVDGKNGVAGRNHGPSNLNMDWERPVNFELITPDGVMAINQEVNFNISGGWSRHWAPASFKIKANKIYEGQNSLNYPFFRYKPFNKYKQIVVRNGGNDNDGAWHGRVRDAITQQVLISSGFYIDAQDYQPAHVFFNGSYIGLLNIREPNNRFHGTANYGYDDDLMDAFEYSNGYFQMAGTKDAFDEVVNMSGMADDPAIYEELCNRIDIDEFINYFAAEAYIGAGDWLTNNNNTKGYRSREDGKFHFVMFDTDSGWERRNLVEMINGNTQNVLLGLYNNLRKNEDFRRQFVTAYCIVEGSVFTPERCLAIGDSICSMVEKALAFENRAPWNSWNEQKGEMINEDSHKARIQSLRTAYGLGEGMKVSVSSNLPQSALMINNQPVPGNRFNGTLFAPVTLTAAAPSGYMFVGWETDDDSSNTVFGRDTEWRYFDRGSLDGSQWKSESYNQSNWGVGRAPLGYYTGGTRDYNTTLNYGTDANNKRPTYYFRKTVKFDEAPSADVRFFADFTADDGFIFYVNGVEVYRYLMPEGYVSYTTYATTYAPNNPDSGTFEIPASAFKAGNNIIAVEVHNNVASSTDIYWACTLRKSGDQRTIVSTNQTLKLDTDASASYCAVFEPKNEWTLRHEGIAPVRINEVSASNERYVNELVKKDDWIEVYNMTDEPCDLSGCFLSDNASKPEKYMIAGVNGANTVVPPHDYLIIWASKRTPESQIHATFKLGNNDGELVMLTAADRSWSDTLVYNAHTGQESYGRYPDGSKAVYRMTIPTIARPNRLGIYDSKDGELEFDNLYTGVEVNVVEASEVISIEYFDLQGRRIKNPSTGIYIRRITLANGHVTADKIAM